MSTTESPLELTALGLAGAALKVRYNSGAGGESAYEPDLIRVDPKGMFLEWPDPPENLKKVQVEWSNNPFIAGTFRCQCTVVGRQSYGMEIEFDDPAPAGLQDWFTGMTAILSRPQPDAALRTSKLYTSATVVSACGLFCGVLAILLPILIGNRGWVDPISKFLLVLMMVSIGGFAWIRALAGREEMRTIEQSRG